MKILVATNKTQGRRKNDFCHTTEDELVMFAFECDGETVDGSCGCRRSFSGCDSHRATTTALVEERLLDTKGYAEIILKALQDGGWVNDPADDEGREWAEKDATELARIADTFKVGAVIEKRGNTLNSRFMLTVPKPAKLPVQEVTP